MFKKLNKSKTISEPNTCSENNLQKLSFEEQLWKKAFILISVCMLFGIIVLSLGSGNSGDEDGFQYPYAEQVFNFYASCGKDTTCLADIDMGMHGGWFDPLTVVVIKAFNIDDYHTVRHIMNALLGFLAILFSGLLARSCGGWRAGVIASLLLFFSPGFLGHSFNNPKDIPFAALFIVSIYYIHSFIQEYPKPSIKTCIKLAVAIALAITSRIGGYLLFAYLGMFIVVYYLIVNKPKDYFSKSNFSVIKYLFFCYLGIMLGAFVMTIPLWPYIMSSPITNTIKAFTDLSHYTLAIHQLFEGALQWSDALPWYYTPKLILLTIPIAVIVGLILFLTFIWKDKKNSFNYFFIFFTFFFPIFWIIYTRANVYGGWRHSLFVYPPMVVAAGLGFNLLIHRITQKTTKLVLINSIATLVILLLLWNPIRHIARNHPYEYIYFNELAGGTKKVYGNYEMDYYYNSTKEASEWILAHAQKSELETGNKIIIATWHTKSVEYFLRKDTANFQVVFSRWYERGDSDWDYAIFTITGLMPEEIKSADFPPKNTVYQVKVDDKPICLVLKRETKDDLIGAQLRNDKQYRAAIPCLKNVVERDPTNIAAFLNLIQVYYSSGEKDSAKIYIDKALEYVPNYWTVNFMLAYYYNELGEQDQALKVLKAIRKQNTEFKMAYQFAFEIYKEKKDFKNAEKILLNYMATGKFEEQTFNQLVEIYMLQGLNEHGAYKKTYNKFADQCEKFDKKVAQKYRNKAKRL